MKRPIPTSGEVTLVLAGKKQKGEIIERISDSAAKIALSDKKEVIASYDPAGTENGTFHFATDAKTAKAEAAPASDNKSQPAAAAKTADHAKK